MRTLLIAALSWLVTNEAQAASTHRALLVGVADYTFDPGWANLGSARDLVAIQSALQRWGFAQQDIRVLADAQATKEGVLAALADLKSASARGDHVYVQYSGHGQQIADDNGDEPDGYDESLVVYGAPMAPPPAYAGDKHLRDEEFGKALEAIRTRLGPEGSLIVVLDSCHSGTATRGSLPTRGGAAPIGKPSAAAAPTSRGAGSDFVGSTSASGLAPQVVLSAARSDQVARETYGEDGQSIGALTQALTLALSSDRPLPSWSAAFERVRAEMQKTVPGQQAQLEGDPNIAVFDAGRSRPAPYITVAGYLPDNKVRLDAGQLGGVTVGSEVELHASGTETPAAATLLSKGKVTSATATSAVVTLESSVATDDARAGRAFVTRYAVSALQLKVDLVLPLGTSEKWVAALKGFPLVSLDAVGAEYAIRLSGADVELTRAADGAVLARAEAARDPGGTEVFAKLKSLATAKLLASVELTGDRHKVAARVLWAEPTEDGCTPTGRLAESGVGGLAVTEGSVFQLEVENLGIADSYLTVAYVDAQGAPVQIVPQPGEKPDKLTPGSKWTVPLCLRAAPPYGAEQLKVFATRNPVDLGPVIGFVPLSTRGAADPFQALLQDAATGTRGLTMAATDQDGWTTTVVYEVVQR